MACALRDGIVGSDFETTTTGPYGVTALTMLTGTEIKCPEPDTFKYVKRGNLKQIHLSLMRHTGKKIRVLRGFTLRSMYAPSAGIRYDGL